MNWKIITKINGKKVDEALSLSRVGAEDIVYKIITNGLEVYSIPKIESVTFSITKLKKKENKND